MLELLNVSKKFGNQITLQNINLQVEAGEFFSLLGSSGCGKTTLLRIIAGFESADQGDLKLNGQSLLQTPPQKRPFNLVFQKYALFPHLTVRENLEFGPRMQKLPALECRERRNEILKLMDLEALADRLPETLSGGQAQRVALGRALINRPQVLLLDEPLSALDLQLREQMQRELRNLQRRLGLCFIFVTHDQDEAFTLSDRIAVMNRGCIEQMSAPQELYEKPRTPFVAEFIGNINKFKLGSEDVYLRPQHLSLKASGEAHEQEITGQLVHQVFRGHFHELHFKTLNGELLRILQETPYSGIFGEHKAYFNRNNILKFTAEPS